MKTKPKRKQFVVYIKDVVDGFWVGEITYINSGEKIPFRSVLELIYLMSSAIEEDKE